MLKRPSPKDTEEDLLRFQDDFLANVRKDNKEKGGQGISVGSGGSFSGESRPAASVYRKRQPDKKVIVEGREREEDEGSGDAAWFPRSTPHDASSILGEIVERHFNASTIEKQLGGWRNVPQGGFPVPELLTLSKAEQATKSARGMSLFARQMAAKQGKENPKEPEGGHENESVSTPSLLTEIDEENRDKLSRMSRREIEADRDQLNKMLSPKTIEFLRKRTAQESISVNPAKNRNVVRFQEISKSKKESPRANVTVADLPVKPESNWAHMDVVEPEKLEWTKDVTISEAATQQLRNFETRFDFAGNIALIPAQVADNDNELPPTSSGLYHHGAEPERPGYTLSELLHLARSTTVQQRVLALRTLAAICQRSRQGFYLAAGLDKPIIPCLLEAGLGFVIRQALDDSSSEGSALAALTALEALLVERNDETLIDAWFSIQPPSKVPFYASRLVASPSSDEQLKNLDDHKLMAQDVVLSLVFRTNILNRLRYILCDWPIPAGQEEVLTLILSVILRIARHSPACCAQIAAGSSGSRLVTEICSDRLLLSNSEGPACLATLALMASAVPTIVSSHFDVNKLLDIVVPVGSNLADFNYEIARSGLRLLGVLCEGNVRPAKDVALAIGQRLVEVETILLSKPEDIPAPETLEYLTAIFQLFSAFSLQDDDQYGSTFEQITYGLLEAVFVVFAEKLAKWLESSKSDQLTLMLAAAYHLSASAKLASTLVVGEGCSRLTNAALASALSASVAHSSKSVILRSNQFTKRRNESPSSLQYLNALKSVDPEETNFSVASWCLASSLFRFLANDQTGKSFQLSEVEVYFKLIASRRSATNFANAFFHLHFEVVFVSSVVDFLSKQPNASEALLKSALVTVIKILPQVSSLFADSTWDVFFDNFLFSPRVLERLGDVSLSSPDSSKFLQAVRSVYRDSLGALLGNPKHCSFSLTALCKDWFYFPLVAAGVTTSLVAYPEDEDKLMPAFRHRVIMSVLRCIRFLFALVPQVMFEELSPLTHFVRLSSLYLNDDVFGGAAGELEGARNLLATCLTSVLQVKSSALDFAETVPGLDCTLPDYYIALLEQFKAASYGDTVFGNILLLFVGARQPVAFRRLLWGDHREALVFLRRLRLPQLLFDVDSLLQPYESSLPVIKLYAEFVFSELLAPGNRQDDLTESVLWLTAINHLNAFLFDSSGHKSGSLLRKSIWQAAAQQCGRSTKTGLKELVYYKYTSKSTSALSADSNASSLQLFGSLPQNRRLFLESVLGKEACCTFLLAVTAEN